MNFLRYPCFRLVALLASTPLIMGSLGPGTNFNDRILAAHNRERAQMGVPLLQWDAALASGAAGWARYLSRTGRFEHSPDDPREESTGENVWGGTPGHYMPENMVGLWLAEKRYYTPGIFPHNSSSGRVQDVSHYTQVIWRRTSRVGCAINAEGKEEVLVCRYSSAGNVMGQATL